METEARLALKARWEAVLERLDKAVTAAGRRAEEVRLIAVSKLHPAEAVAELALLGQRDFGENYVQEALEKQRSLDNVPGLARDFVRWHMIGHVQSRKASQVSGRFCLIHSLDSRHLADALEKRCAALNHVQPVLMEVNVGDEAQKSGLLRTDLQFMADHVLAACPHLSLQGLMCIPPVFDAGEAARPYFALLRDLRKVLRGTTGLPLPELSMGMSGDFEWAVLEGATSVRVGTDIFGPRPSRKA